MEPIKYFEKNGDAWDAMRSLRGWDDARVVYRDGNGWAVEMGDKDCPKYLRTDGFIG